MDMTLQFSSWAFVQAQKFSMGSVELPGLSWGTPVPPSLPFPEKQTQFIILAGCFTVLHVNRGSNLCHSRQSPPEGVQFKMALRREHHSLQQYYDINLNIHTVSWLLRLWWRGTYFLPTNRLCTFQVQYRSGRTDGQKPSRLFFLHLSWLLWHLPGGVSKVFLTQPLDRPDGQVLQVRQEVLELPGW